MAIPLSAEALFAISNIQKSVSKVDKRIVAVPSDQLFIRLHYLGSVPEKQLYLLVPKLYELVKTMNPFQIEIAFLETRYNRHEKSQILLNLKIDEAFKHISQFLDQHQLYQPRRVIPELTIAYVAKEDPTQVKRILSDVDDLDIGKISTLDVQKLLLVEELWSKKGVYLRVVSQLPLNKFLNE